MVFGLGWTGGGGDDTTGTGGGEGAGEGVGGGGRAGDGRTCPGHVLQSIWCTRPLKGLVRVPFRPIILIKLFIKFLVFKFKDLNEIVLF